MIPNITTVLLLVGVSLSVVCAREAFSKDLQKELTLTQKEKVAFQQFKGAVIKNITEPELVLMRTDLYLLRFIRSKNLDVDAAIKDLFTYLKFIRDEHLLNLLKEDWSDMLEDYPIDFTSNSTTGQPIMFLTTANGWNVQRAILAGKGKRFIRYLYKAVFEIYTRIAEYGKKDPTITKTIVLFDLEGFNLFQQGCPSCILQYINFFEVFERWVPGYIDEFIWYNAAPSINLVLQGVRPFLSPETQRALKIFGFNKNVWGPYIEERVSKEQFERLYRDPEDNLA